MTGHVASHTIRQVSTEQRFLCLYRKFSISTTRPGAGEKALSAKCLPRKHKGLSPAPAGVGEAGIVEYSSNPSTEEGERDPEAHRLSSLTNCQVPGTRERSCPNKPDGWLLRNDTQGSHTYPHTCAPTFTCARTHKHTHTELGKE